VPGIVGCFMALKTIAVILGKFENINQLQLINLLTAEQSFFEY
jgi:hypothetical protein